MRKAYEIARSASPGYESCGSTGCSAKHVEGTFFRYMEGSIEKRARLD
jgi:hypothetical protein